MSQETMFCKASEDGTSHRVFAVFLEHDQTASRPLRPSLSYPEFLNIWCQAMEVQCWLLDFTHLQKIRIQWSGRNHYQEGQAGAEGLAFVWKQNVSQVHQCCAWYGELAHAADFAWWHGSQVSNLGRCVLASTGHVPFLCFQSKEV